jgi:hypothetical protein
MGPKLNNSKHASSRTVFTLTVLTFLLSFSDCKKFPEDNTFSLRTVNKRFYQYKWEIKTLLLEGTDVTGNYNDSLLIGDLSDLDLNFAGSYSKDHFDCNMYWKNIPADTFHIYSYYELNAKDKTFTISNFQGPAEGRAGNDHKIIRNLFHETFKILKLYKKEFTIKNSNGIEIQFEGHATPKN